eukprot:jgi/Hompol1/5370/HPOL_001196-RA
MVGIPYTVNAPVRFQAGSFDFACSQVALPLCSLVGDHNQEPLCYSRNIEEIVLFFYLYAATTVIDFFVLSGIIPAASQAFPYFVAIEMSLVMATLWSLFINGFVPFQWIEDGSPLSLWTLRLTSLAAFLLTFFISIGTFKGVAGLAKATPTLLWIWYFAFGAAFVLIYIICQVVIVFTSLEDRWPLADISFGVFFFLAAQIMNFALSSRICDLAQHYVDGTFFGATATLLSVMMVYKFWDSITKEDLEFSVGGKSNNWEINDPLLGDNAMASMAKGDFEDVAYPTRGV